MDYGTRIKELRKNKKISARSLALNINLDPSQISKIENNASKPSLDSLEKICTALGITLSDFFAEEPNYLPPELAKIAKQYNSLTEKKKNAIRAILDLLEE
ncbi:MAG: helix-turn-helix domain-containing protein [bacterium]